jgi:osmotically-inducible protein OsmY
MAKKIAAALKGAKMRGKGISLEYRNGTCQITGDVPSVKYRALASKVIAGVPGVDNVDNRLTVDGAAAPRSLPSQVARAGYEGGPRQQVQQVSHEAPALDNQSVAQSIADALSSSGLSGYDIEVRFSNGVATLAGKVDSPAAAERAHQACQGVPGVQQVNNRLTVNGLPAVPPQQPGIMPAGYPQLPTQGMPPQMAMAPMQGLPPQMAMHPGAGMPGQAPAPMMAHPGMGGPVSPAGHMIYNQPNVPEYAWPSYAPYDNSAAVTYPSAYDASAWPYIGPYYPYPQVPLGWRKASLEWDDGQWNLKFNSRTDRWWWFLNPHNWTE